MDRDFSRPNEQMADVWGKTYELIANGVPNLWIVELETLDSQLWTAGRTERSADKTLRLPRAKIDDSEKDAQLKTPTGTGDGVVSDNAGSLFQNGS
jgi:hypothetical protein